LPGLVIKLKIANSQWPDDSAVVAGRVDQLIEWAGVRGPPGQRAPRAHVLMLTILESTGSG